MDLQDQLRNYFPDHKFSEKTSSIQKKANISHTQINPLICKYQFQKNWIPNRDTLTFNFKLLI